MHKATRCWLSWIAWLAPWLAVSGAAAQGTSFTQIEKGRYLVRAGDCFACHTESGGAPFAGGRAIVTPFGTIYSTNITPDPDTGIGRWSEQDFYRAMHEGIRRDGSHLYPAFPYPWFTRITRDDVRAIKAYMDRVAPVRRANKPTELFWPLNWREAMAAWDKLYFHDGTYAADGHKSAAWNRGAYLVEGLGHCGACHTSRNILGAAKVNESLQGGRFGSHWYAPSLARDFREGLGSWSPEDIAQYLKTGENLRTSAVGPMAEVVKDSTQYLTDADVHAIAVYLKDLPSPREHDDGSSMKVSRDSFDRGRALYVDNCSGCHMYDGGGVPDVFPPLKGSGAVQAKDPGTVVSVVLEGARKPATSGHPAEIGMPAFEWKLDDQQVADLANYVRSAWGNRAAAVAPSAVASLRHRVDRAP